jgi:hypothetical protein
VGANEPPPPARPPGLAPPDRLSGWVGAVVALRVTALLATSGRYGSHRDELSFIVAGSHPAFGYPDQPPPHPRRLHERELPSRTGRGREVGVATGP